ncbi:hypothetical protein Leryth_023547 [Lithospermum erythrorhizon]|nr:hypothetical protein Leryth_023547 [Lithospermum erythrorhizon]
MYDHIWICLAAPLFASRNGNTNSLVLNSSTRNFSRVIVRQSLVEQTAVDMKKLVDFLYEDLPHLFDDKGIDRTAYDERVKFRDPITKHDTISGYLFNIAMLKRLFRPDFQLHWVKQMYLMNSTRWTMVMTFMLLPWKPELIFTGTSEMGVNPETNKFCSHVNNDYFSVEGLLDVFKQLRIYKTPDLESPNYQILKRTATYEVCNIFLFMHYWSKVCLSPTFMFLNVQELMIVLLYHHLCLSSATCQGVLNDCPFFLESHLKIYQNYCWGLGIIETSRNGVKRLEEVSVSCRGAERVQLMKAWLSALKETEMLSNDEQQHALEEQKQSPKKDNSLVLYYDPDMGEPMTFHDVFLYSQALEGISICMILQAPNEDEVSLLELYGICLTGGKEVQYAIVSSIQDLAKAFSGNKMAKREELLQFAEGAITV